MTKTTKRVKTDGEAQTRSPKYRHQDPLLVERAAEWDAQARQWARECSIQIFSAAQESPDLTAGDVVVELDRRSDIPVGYAQYIQPQLYDNRYQMVRTVLEQLGREGFLNVGTTVNARGRKDVKCFRRAPPPSTWLVEVEPNSPETVAFKAVLENYLREHSGSLRGIDTVLISRQFESGTLPGGQHGKERWQDRTQT